MTGTQRHLPRERKTPPHALGSRSGPHQLPRDVQVEGTSLLQQQEGRVKQVQGEAHGCHGTIAAHMLWQPEGGGIPGQDDGLAQQEENSLWGWQWGEGERPRRLRERSIAGPRLRDATHSKMLPSHFHSLQLHTLPMCHVPPRLPFQLLSPQQPSPSGISWATRDSKGSQPPALAAKDALTLISKEM